MVEKLIIDRMPELHDPVAVVAFSGWNDAASAATDAAKFIVDRLNARPFAQIDAEPFFDFTDVRPTVSVDARGHRTIKWPENRFYYARNPAGAHDVIVSLGVEPQLAWRSFVRCHIDLYRQAGVSMVVSLGALLADVPHTRPPRVTGTALDPEVAARLDLATSRYQGPTGIVGVLHDTLRREAVAAASLWANVPHYITTSSNPPATVALLGRLQGLLDLRFDLRELRAAGERFVAEVDAAVAANDEIAEYVRRLEASEDEPAEHEGEPLPRAEEVVLDVERFLRRLRPGDTGPDE